MAWLVKHLQDHPSGRKSYRRPYPPRLRPYLTGTQLRVSLGYPADPGFLSRYEKAAAEWAGNVALAERKQACAFDALDTPTIAYLAEAFRVEAISDDDAARWDTSERDLYRAAAGQLETAGGSYGSPWSGREGERWAQRVRENVELFQPQYLAMRSNGDLDAIVGWWREEALILAEARGYVVDPSHAAGIAALCRALNDAAISANKTRLERLRGEEYPETPEEPARPSNPAQSRHAAVPLQDTYDAYAEAQGIRASGRREGRNYIKHLSEFLGHDDAALITREDVVAWRDKLLKEPTKSGKERKAVTVRDKYMVAIRCVLGFAFEDLKLLPSNVAADVRVRVPKKVVVRDADFTIAEARAILRATFDAPPSRLSAPYARARRWIPWLCAYTGCRVNEMSQLRKEDVRNEDGVWIVNITPEAGDVKTRTFRATPIHSHLIEQGFLAMVEELPEGPLFYDPSLRRAAEGDDNRHVKKVGERLAQWVRQIVGIADPNIKPNHGWRHTFKTLASEAGIEERVADAIQGHAPVSVSRRYGKVTLRTKADALARFPRFDLSA